MEARPHAANGRRMQKKNIDDWRRAERAATEAEGAARSAAGSEQQRELLAEAKRLRAHADRLWREFLGSSLAPLAPEPTAPDPARSKPADLSALNQRIEEWRRGQARAHAAEVKAVHAYSRFAKGTEDEPPYAWQAEALMLRAESAQRLQRIYDEAARLRRGQGPAATGHAVICQVQHATHELQRQE